MDIERMIETASTQLTTFGLKVLGAIHWEAIRLWKKRVGFWHAPSPPAHSVTLGAAVGDNM